MGGRWGKCRKPSSITGFPISHSIYTTVPSHLASVQQRAEIVKSCDQLCPRKVPFVRRGRRRKVATNKLQVIREQNEKAISIPNKLHHQLLII